MPRGRCHCQGVVNIISFAVSGKPSKYIYIIPLECLCPPWDNEGNRFNVAVVDRLESSHNLVLVDLVQSVYVPLPFLEILIK